MKRINTIFAALFAIVSLSLAESNLDLCPTFTGLPSWGNVVGYNLNATPWNFILDVAGDTTDLHVQWYTYQYGQQLKDTVRYDGPGSNTVGQCYPATDKICTSVTYVCVVKTKYCSQGIVYKDASATVYGNCERLGSTFIIENAASSYVEGSQIKLTAYYDGQGGFHYYTWYKDGVAIDSTAEHQIWNDPNNFNYSVLTIPSCELADAGKYSIKVSDGTNGYGTPCAMTVTNPKTITVTPKQPGPEPEPTCQNIIYTKWDNLLFVDNGKNQFTAYQWYKDNAAIAGETKQYLHTYGVAMLGDGHQYYVVATRTDGKLIKACAGKFADFPKGEISNQNAIRRVALYTNMGVKVGEWSDIPSEVHVAPGAYVWHYTDNEGHTWMNKTVY